MLKLKFAWIVLCFAVTAISRLRCHNRRDWAFLMAGMAFTLVSDYFLVLHDNRPVGVAVFCFAHAAYFYRVAPRRYRWVPPVVALTVFTISLLLAISLFAAPFTATPCTTSLFTATLFTAPPFAATPFITSLFTVPRGLGVDVTAIISVIYAGLFVADIAACAFNYRRGWNGLPTLNRALMLAGVLLFALCDVNVLLFNLPSYVSPASPGLIRLSQIGYALIWVFYAPSQLLLAVSALRFPASPRSCKRSQSHTRHTRHRFS